MIFKKVPLTCDVNTSPTEDIMYELLESLYLDNGENFSRNDCYIVYVNNQIAGAVSSKICGSYDIELGRVTPWMLQNAIRQVNVIADERSREDIALDLNFNDMNKFFTKDYTTPITFKYIGSYQTRSYGYILADLIKYVKRTDGPVTIDLAIAKREGTTNSTLAWLYNDKWITAYGAPIKDGTHISPIGGITFDIENKASERIKGSIAFFVSTLNMQEPLTVHMDYNV